MSKTTPEDLAKKRSDEKMLVSEMIALYCRKQHHTLRGSLCPVSYTHLTLPTN